MGRPGERQWHKTLISRKTWKQLHWIESHTLPQRQPCFGLPSHCKISSFSASPFPFSISVRFPFHFRFSSWLAAPDRNTAPEEGPPFSSIFFNYGSACESQSSYAIISLFLSDFHLLTLNYSPTNPFLLYQLDCFLDPAWWQNKQKFLQDTYCSGVRRRSSWACSKFWDGCIQ